MLAGGRSCVSSCPYPILALIEQGAHGRDRDGWAGESAGSSPACCSFSPWEAW